MRNKMVWWRLLLMAVMMGGGEWAVAQSARPEPIPPPIPPPRPTPAPMRQRVFSKDATGTITSGRLEWTLRSNTTTDQTAEFFPDGSRLVSEEINFQLSPGGVGRYHGAVKLVASDGKTLMAGSIQGIAGLTSARGDRQQARKAGHYEGMLQLNDYAAVPPSPRDSNSADEGAAAPLSPPPAPARSLTASFSADALREALSPLPLFRVHLDGVLYLPPLPPPVVSILSDKRLYPIGAPITAIVRNPTQQTLYVSESNSLCTMVVLQRMLRGEWVNQLPCTLARPAVLTEIGPGEVKRVILRSGEGASAIAPGTYRLALPYRVRRSAQSATFEQWTYSEQFRVAAEPPVAGSVTVTTNKEIYQTTDVIIATIDNKTERAIRTEDHQSFCTVLSLMRRTNGDWERVSDCLTLAPTQMITIGARQKLQVSLPEAVPTIYPPQPNFEPGEYRLDFTFVPVGNGQTEGERQTISSAPFQVRGQEAEGVKGRAVEKLIGGVPLPNGEPNVTIQPFPGAILILQSADGRREVGRAIANSLGQFRIPAPPGEYRLVGKRPVNSAGLPEPAPISVRVVAGLATEVTVEFMTPLPSPPPRSTASESE